MDACTWASSARCWLPQGGVFCQASKNGVALQEFPQLRQVLRLDQEPSLVSNSLALKEAMLSSILPLVAKRAEGVVLQIAALGSSSLGPHSIAEVGLQATLLERREARFFGSEEVDCMPSIDALLALKLETACQLMAAPPIPAEKPLDGSRTGLCISPGDAFSINEPESACTAPAKAPVGKVKGSLRAHNFRPASRREKAQVAMSFRQDAQAQIAASCDRGI